MLLKVIQKDTLETLVHYRHNNPSYWHVPIKLEPCGHVYKLATKSNIISEFAGSKISIQ